MDYYKTQTEFNCGIDLHTNQMYVCVMDPAGEKLAHSNVRHNDFGYFLNRVEPYRHDLTVVCESTCNWYWLADACFEADIEFVLAHALYLKHIHGGKNKNDRIDSKKLAHLLRTNLIPPAYAHPAARRPARGLFRQRMRFVWDRSTLMAQLGMNQYAVKDFLSYCRLVKGSVSSAGKFKGLKGSKMGNAYLRWAFGHAAVIAKRGNPLIGAYAKRLTAKHGKFKANAILGAKIARAIYFMLERNTVFDVDKLVSAKI